MGRSESNVLIVFLLWFRLCPGIDGWMSPPRRPSSARTIGTHRSPANHHGSRPPCHFRVIDERRRLQIPSFAAPTTEDSDTENTLVPKLTTVESEESSANLDGNDSKPQTSGVPRQLSELSTWMLVGAALTVFVVWPILSQAIDHPIDHALLGIPTTPVPDARFFVAGGLCAAASHGITTPVDVVKTRMQADPELRQAGLQKATMALLQSEGPGTLLQGLGPTIGGYGLEGALKFGLYESAKPLFAALLHTTDTAVPYLFASVAAGAAASIVLCPMEQLRIRAVTDPNFGGLTTLVSEVGIVGLFRGLPSMLSKQVPYTFGKQVTFDEFAALLYTVCASTWGWTEAQLKYQVPIVAAFLASMVACVLSHPGDVVVTRTYQKSRDDNRGGGPEDWHQRSFGRVVQRIYEDQGVGGFWSGISARFVHVGVIVTSQLVLYDVVKQLLGLPASGAH